MILIVFRNRIHEEQVIVKKNYLKTPAYFLAIIAITVFGVLWFESKSYHIDNYIAFEERDDIMRDFLVNIPSDKKIAASGYLTTYLADREVLYDLQFIDLDETDIIFDYVIIDKRIAVSTQEAFQEEAINNGYRLSDLSSEYFIILVPVS